MLRLEAHTGFPGPLLQARLRVFSLCSENRQSMLCWQEEGDSVDLGVRNREPCVCAVKVAFEWDLGTWESSKAPVLCSAGIVARLMLDRRGSGHQFEFWSPRGPVEL